jgi:hypothetical protein
MSLEGLIRVIRTSSDHQIDLSTRRGSKAAAEVNVRAMQEPCNAFRTIAMFSVYGHHDRGLVEMGLWAEVFWSQSDRTALSITNRLLQSITKPLFIFPNIIHLNSSISISILPHNILCLLLITKSTPLGVYCLLVNITSLSMSLSNWTVIEVGLVMGWYRGG